MNYYNALLSLLFGCLVSFVYATDPEIERHQLQHIEQATNFDMIQTFRTPKKVLFSCLFGGSSHNHWVISILNELYQRGHNTTYITKDDQLKFTRNYPNINAISIGEKTTEDKDKVWTEFRTETSLDSKVWGIANIVTVKMLKEDYTNLYNWMNDEKYDVAICDLFNDPCQLAAFKLNIPTIVTASLPVTNDVSAPYINIDTVSTNVPTTQYMTLWERIRDKVIIRFLLAWKLRYFLFEQAEMYKSIGIKFSLDPQDRWRHCVKMFNTAFGIQQGRPAGPLVEFVGPILKAQVPKLTAKLEYYLNKHERIAYIAFGQLTKMTMNDATLILSGLIEAYEHDEIDGFIWATRALDNTFPEFIISRSNTSYNIRSYLSTSDTTDNDFAFLNWAPQMAILNHSATSLFITHGGSASLYESLYSGTRMVIYPFFVDQPFAAATAEKNGYGLKLTSTASRSEAIEIIRRVARDENNIFQRNTDRFQALVQIRSKNGVVKGADLVEEVMFLSENGKITHRRDVRDDLSFLKANNIDIYFIVGTFVCLISYLVVRFTNFITTAFSNSLKIKVL